jgi:WD40 repeat protein
LYLKDYFRQVFGKLLLKETTMSDDLLTSVVRILKSDESTSGTGFLISKEGLIVTCSHVVQNEESQRRSEAKPEKVIVILHATGEKREAIVHPDLWRGTTKDDIAFLHLQGSLPPQIKPLTLGSSVGTSGHRFKTFGFPDLVSIEGMWGYGLVGDPLSGEFGRPLLQLTGTTEITPGFSGGPVLDITTNRIVGMITSILAPDRFGRLTQTAFITPSEILRDICPSLQLSDVCPYLGLASFGENDSKFFFGRQRVLDSFLESLRRESGFLAILGPSGSGKSSVVHAKLIPALRQGELQGSDKWGIISILRSDNPFRQLEEQGLLNSRGDLAKAVQTWLSQHPNKTRLVLILDQFEEFLLACPNGQNEMLSQNIKKLLSSPLPVTVILVMRDDFYSLFVKQMPELMKWVERGLVNVPSTLEKDELIDIIQEPTKVVGLKFEAGLVELILNNVLNADMIRDASCRAGRSTILPLLEFALTELWYRRKDGILTHEAYNSIGGVTGGLTTRAEMAFLSLDDRMRTVARCIFTALVRLGTLPGSLDSRQRRPLEKLCVKERDRDLVRKTIDKLTDERLLMTFLDQDSGLEIIDIIHETLIREWARLQQWLNEDHRFLLWSQETEVRAKKWIETSPSDASKRDEGKLLRGKDLAEAEGWLNERKTELNPDIRAYLQACIDLHLQELAERRRLERRTIKVLAAGFVIALSLALIAGYYWQETSKQKEISLSNQLAAQSELIRNQQASHLPMSVALAVESLKRHYSPDAEDILRRGLSMLRKRELTVSHKDIVYSVTFSPDGKYFASASADKTAKLWDAATGKEIFTINHSDVVWNVAISPDSRYLATASSDKTAIICDILNGHEFKRIKQNGSIRDVDFSPDSKYVATASDDNTSKLLNLITGAIITLNHSARINDVCFSPDGRYLATASDDYSAKLWTITGREIGQVMHKGIVQSVCFNRDGSLLATGSGDNTAALWWTLNCSNKFVLHHDNFVNSVAFSPSGDNLASGSWDNTARVWDVARGIEISRMFHEDGIRRIAFSPDGDLLATASFDNTGRLWLALSGGVAAIMPHNDSVNSVAFSPDGRLLATTSNDRTVSIWNARDDREVAHISHQNIISKLAFSSDGKYLATASDDNLASIWDMTFSRIIMHIRHLDAINDIAFSTDGKYILTASDDKTAGLWNITTGHEDTRIVHDDVVWTAVFSPDEKYILTASDDKTARLWNITTGQEVVKMAHSDRVWEAAFSPDGKYILTASEDNSARLWNAHNGAEILSLLHDDHVNGAIFSPEGNFIVTKSEDGIVYLWDAENGKKIWQVSHNSPVESIAFSSNSKYIATGSDDGYARIIDAKNGNEVTNIRHEGTVWCVTFSPDNKYIAAGSGDKTARISEILDGKEIEIFPFNAQVNALAFSPNGQFLATATFDGRANIWRWQIDDPIKKACEYLTRNPSSREWSTYLGDEEPYYKICPNLP